MASCPPGWCSQSYCNQLNRKINDLQNYITAHEPQWLQDIAISNIISGGGGLDSEDIAEMIEDAINWLKGIDLNIGDYEQRIAEALDSYFVKKSDYQEEHKKLQDKVAVMEEFLSKKFGKEYCNYEAFRLIEMGWKKVECGNTTYFPKEGGGVITITPA